MILHQSRTIISIRMGVKSIPLQKVKQRIYVTTKATYNTIFLTLIENVKSDFNQFTPKRERGTVRLLSLYHFPIKAKFSRSAVCFYKFYSHKTNIILTFILNIFTKESQTAECSRRIYCKFQLFRPFLFEIYRTNITPRFRI